MSALTTGTPAYAAIVARSSCAKVRHTIADAWRPIDAGDVGDRLALADRGQPAVDHHREPAELGDAGAERRLRPQRRLVEDHRHAARAREGTRGVRVVAQPGGEVEDDRLLGRVEVVVGEQVPHRGAAHDAPPSGPRRRGTRAAPR